MAGAGDGRGGRTPAAEAATAALLGILGGLLGLAPWLLTGAHLPVQNLWGRETQPGDMPVALLPLSQYRSTTLVALLTVGASAAGLALRVLKPARRRFAAACAVGGVLLVHCVAAVQSFAVLSSGLDPEPRSSIYMAGLLGGTIAAIGAGVVALLVLASPSRPDVALGLGLMAVPFASWLAAGAAFPAGPGGVPIFLTIVWHWLPAVLVGVALSWCGFKPPIRLWVWAVDLALLWLVPALFTSVNYVLGTRAYLGNFSEMAILSREILAATLGPAGGAGPIVLMALGVGLVGALSMAVLARKRRRPEPAPHGGGGQP
ncbi:MAG TPA: hypothetical protein VJQ80_16535 [Arthrobacter sp.]|nr:hypothetical protein [Arthrobacter sp.]